MNDEQRFLHAYAQFFGYPIGGELAARTIWANVSSHGVENVLKALDAIKQGECKIINVHPTIMDLKRALGFVSLQSERKQKPVEMCPYCFGSGYIDHLEHPITHKLLSIESEPIDVIPNLVATVKCACCGGASSEYIWNIQQIRTFILACEQRRSGK